MMQIPLEQSFIKRLANGEKEAITDWYDYFSPQLLAVCMRYAGSVMDAEDILHNAMMKMLKALPSFDYNGTGRFEAWMKKIVINTALNQLRERSKEKLVSLDINRIEPLNGHDENDTDDVDFRPEADQLIEWIQSLPAGYRTVLNLYVFEQYSHKEIAHELGITENTSKSQLSKARAFLRKKASAINMELETKNNG